MSGGNEWYLVGCDSGMNILRGVADIYSRKTENEQIEMVWSC